jgi:hypothetical protein
MPTPYVVLDRVEDAQIVVDKGRYTATRTGMIYDLDTTLDPKLILASGLVATGMPAEGTAWDPYPSAILTRKVIDTIPGINYKAKLILTYEQPGPSSGGIVTFVLTRSKQLINTETELHPKNKEPMRYRWFNPSHTADRKPYTNARLPYLKPLKSLIATGYIIGGLPAGLDAAFGTVNNATWQGYPKGYWLFTGDDDTTQDFGASFNVRLEFLTRATEDWSEWSVFKDSYGNSLPVDPADTAALQGAAYSYGFDRSKNGILKAGLYDLKNFNTLFGF